MIKWNEAVDALGNRTQEFRHSRSQNRDVTGALWIPQKKLKNTLIVFGHGASGDRYQAPICNLANRFREKGYTSLSMDGPVHGLREVSPGGREAFTIELRSPSVIEDMTNDWKIAIEIASNKTTLPEPTIAYFGLSMGSIFGIPLLGSLSKENDKTIVATLGLLGTTGAVKFLGHHLKKNASELTAPILFLMQLEDELFPRDGYLELFDAIGSEDKTLHANPGLHPQVPAAEIDYAFQFMLDHIEGESTHTDSVSIAE